MSTMKLIVEIDGTTKLEMKRELTEVPPSKGPIVMPGFRESPPLREIAKAFMGGDKALEDPAGFVEDDMPETEGEE